jgi:hypothetical protein
MDAVVMGFTGGGGIVLVIKPDGVEVLRVPVDVKLDEPLEVLGTTNREHMRVVAVELIDALIGARRSPSGWLVGCDAPEPRK